MTGFAFSLLIALWAVGLLIARNWSGENAGGVALKAALALGVMALQRVTRKFGRSIFFAMGIILAVSAALSVVIKDLRIYL